MADYQQNNGNNNQFNITSNSLVFFDNNSRMLRCTFLNDSLGISFVNPTIDEGGKKIYKGAPSENLLLTKDRVAALYDIVIRKVLGAVESHTKYNGGVFTNQKKDGVFEICVDNDDIYAVYHKEIDGDRRPKTSIDFHFTKTPIVEKYKPGEADFEITEINANFALFVKMLEGFMLVAQNASSGHGYRMVEKLTTDRLFAQIGEIATKLGVTVNNYRPRGFNNGTTSSGSGFQEPQYQEASDLGSLLKS